MVEDSDGQDSEWRKGRCRLNGTIGALVGRGVDRALAEKLFRSGWTIGKLKQQSKKCLLEIGLAEPLIANMLAGARPPVPFPDLATVLVANRFTCCVCHETERSVVVHHIVSWAESHDHSPANLAVLCLDHHDLAHKRGGLTQNLTADLVKKAKAAWETQVARLDTRSILEASALDHDAWWFFNHNRLFALARHLKIDLRRLGEFRIAHRHRLADNGGGLRKRDVASSWMYEGGDGMALYEYVRAVLHAVLEQLTVLNITDDVDRSLLDAVVKPGDFVFLQGSYVFKRNRRADSGPGQTIIGLRRANNVEVSFTIDRWEATSHSAWSVWLNGRQAAACVLRVMKVERTEGRLHIATTAFAIGAALQGLQHREYANAPYRSGYVIRDDQDEDEDEDSALGDFGLDT
jgi:hypothetical protein